MTTQDQPDGTPTQEPRAEAAPDRAADQVRQESARDGAEATPASPGTDAAPVGGAHTAPRPVPPLDVDTPAEQQRATGAAPGAAPDGAGEAPAPPARVSAFPPITRGGAPTDASTTDASTTDATTALPVPPSPPVPPAPATAAPATAAPGEPDRGRAIRHETLTGADRDNSGDNSGDDSARTVAMPAVPSDPAEGTPPASPPPSPGRSGSAGAATSSTIPLATDREVTTTQVVPPTSAPPSSPDSLATPGRTPSQPREAFPDQEWNEGPPKRIAVHIWGVFLTLLALPVAWFLLTDGAQRIYYSLPTTDSAINLAGIFSLVGGLAALVVVALIAQASSLGAWIWGGVVSVAGILALIFHRVVAEWMIEHRDGFLTVHQGFGENLFNYLLDTGRSGLLLLLGVIVLLFALISHSARRSGRAEGRWAAERELRER